MGLNSILKQTSYLSFIIRMESKTIETVAQVANIDVEMKDESLNSSSDSITGKRVRKKNPKYLDEEIPTEDNINNNNGVSKKSGGSRPKKKRKISHQPSVVQDIVVSSTTTITTSVESFASLSKKKVDLHNQIKKIADELVELEKQLEKNQQEHVVMVLREQRPENQQRRKQQQQHQHLQKFQLFVLKELDYQRMMFNYYQNLCFVDKFLMLL